MFAVWTLFEVFTKELKLAIMTILASDTLPQENKKKSSNKMVPQWEPGASTIWIWCCSPWTMRHVLLGRSVRSFSGHAPLVLTKLSKSKIQGRQNSSVGNVSDLVTHHWAAHHCVGGSNPDACERSLASHAIYMLIQCTPLLVEKAGVAPVVTFRITAHKQERVQVRYPLWIWNPSGRTHEVQNRSNQWLHKWTLVQRKKLKKKKKKIQVVQEQKTI